MSLIKNVTYIDELKIYKFVNDLSNINTLEDVAALDITLLGLNQSFWEIFKGRRIHRCYYSPDETQHIEANSIVKFDCEYTFDTNNHVTALTTKIQFMDNSGAVGIEKTILKSLSPTYMISLNREIRENQIDNLRGRGEDLRVVAATLTDPAKTQYIQVADAVDSLWVHYKDEINEYINTGNTVFKDTVTNETDTTILGILGIVVNSDGITTVEDSIINEIS